MHGSVGTAILIHSQIWFTVLFGRWEAKDGDIQDGFLQKGRMHKLCFFSLGKRTQKMRNTVCGVSAINYIPNTAQYFSSALWL